MLKIALVVGAVAIISAASIMFMGQVNENIESAQLGAKGANDFEYVDIGDAMAPPLPQTLP